MKTNKILAVALSAGLVLGGASVANAQEDSGWNGYDDSWQAGWEAASAEQDKKLAEEKEKEKVKEKEKEVDNWHADPYEEGWKKASAEQDKKLAEEKAKEKDSKKPEENKRQTLDEWQIEQNEKDGYFTKEDALRAGNLALDKAKLRGLYEVEVRKNAVQDRWFWRFVPVEKAEDKKPEDKKPEVKPNQEVKPTPDYTPAKPEDKTPAAPAENDKEVDKLIKDLNDSQKKINDLLEQNEKENAELNKKDKKEKDKKENKKAKKQAPAKQGTNPKTGVVGLGSVASLAAISMAGIVATRKRK